MDSLRWVAPPPDDDRLSYDFLLSMKKKLYNFSAFLRTWNNPAEVVLEQVNGKKGLIQPCLPLRPTPAQYLPVYVSSIYRLLVLCKCL